MQVSKTTRLASRCLGNLGILLALGGCLSGGAEDDAAAPHFQQRQQITLTGSVGDGPVVGAAMVATTPTDEVIAEFESDAGAGYSVVLEVESSDFPLIISATGGTDLVTNLAPDFALSGAAVAPGGSATANVNPFTTFAVEVANRLAGGPSASNIADAEDLVVAALDTGLTTMLVQGPLATPVDETNIAEIVRASEALAEIVRRTRDHLAIPASDVIAAVSADLTDGIVDGVGPAPANPRIAAVWSLVTAQVLLETLTNTLYVNGSNAMSAMDAAITRVSTGTPQPSLQELTATTAMLDRTRVGLSAAWAITGDPDIADLAAAVDRIRAGMSASLARIALPNDFQSRLDIAIGMVVSGDNSVVDTVNTVVREGGTTITPNNNPPAISGNPPATVEAGDAYSFTPSASDADGDALTFSIVGKPAWATFAASSGRLSGTPGISDVGTYADIRISVSDGSNSTSLAAFSIEVTNGNAAPTISGSPPLVVDVDATYSFLPTANDADGDPLTFSISNSPAWAVFNSSTGGLSGTPGSSDVGSYLDIVITVSDGQHSASLGPFTINVVADNAPPGIAGSGGATLAAGTAYDFQPTASDPDGDPLSFTITNQPSWTAFDSATGRLSGTPTADNEGTFSNIIIRVSDGASTSSLAAFSITVTVPNSPPTIGGTPGTQVDAGTAYSFTPTANDADGDDLSFSISGRPAWASFSQATGQLSGTPGTGAAGTYSNIRISVTDGTATATLAAFSITVVAPNSAPTISGTPAAAVNVNTAYSFTPIVNDPDGDTLTFSISNSPAWAVFNSSTGGLSGTPGSSDVGSYLDIVITVSDGQHSASLGPFTINVVADNTPPSIAGSGAATLAAGTAYDFQPTASDPDGDPLSFTITNPPSWTAFDSATGRLSGTPTAADEGTFSNIIIRVSDGASTSSLAAFSITVTVPNSPPTIGGTPGTQVDAGTAYSFTPTANDADGDDLSFSISGRPAWASFSQVTGQLSGTPGTGAGGAYSNIRISVTDGTATATLAAFSITVVAPNSAPTISGTPAAAVNVNTAYSFTPTVNDPDGDTLTFSITGMPAWANFDTSSGRLAGTPGDADVGVYGDIRITVSDGTGSATLGPFSISVNAVSNGSATLSWTAPTQNTDGSALTDLAGYKLYWRNDSGAYANSITISNPSVTTYIVENLAAGTYEFVATAFNSQNAESDYSASATITVP